MSRWLRTGGGWPYAGGESAMTAQRSEATDVLVPLTKATDPDVVGTKAATLAALKAAGLPVPDGVVIPAGSDDVSTSALTEAIGRWGNVPVAVRSSGVAEDLPDASYAGMYTTVLNVRRSEEHTSELQSRENLVCRLLLEKKNTD